MVPEAVEKLMDKIIMLEEAEKMTAKTEAKHTDDQADRFRNTIASKREEIAMLKEINAELLEAIEPLIDIAESYAMQTYDRHGVTRKKIEAAKAAIAKAEGK